MNVSAVISADVDQRALSLAQGRLDACCHFVRDLVTLPSPSRAERLACELVQREMERLGFRDVFIDDMGNVLGRVGSGKRVLAYDAHVDTVGISNPRRWRYDPFKGVITGGTLYGRGASDQKGGLGAAVYGAALAAELGLLDGVTVWVTATVNGEDCVGLGWQYLLSQTDLAPEAVAVAMPSHLGVCRGQRGRMELKVTIGGESSHGSQPDRGRNAIYDAAPVVLGLKRLHEGLSTDHDMLGRGTLAVTGISSRSPSTTAVPDETVLHIDRRLTIGETSEEAVAQIRTLPEIEACTAEVEVLRYELPSWRGHVFPTKKIFPAWVVAEDSAVVRAALQTAASVLGRKPRMHRSASSSTGCATAGLSGIPTIGFGPADEIHSHTVEDQIPLVQLPPAMAFYALFPSAYLMASDS